MRRFATPDARVLLAILVLAFLGGCASSSGQQMKLKDTLNSYQALIRWGDFSSALQFVHPEHMPTPREAKMNLKRFEQVQITSYRPLSKSPTGDKNLYLQTMELRFANRHNMIERTIQDRQVWRWEPANERWLLVSGLPDITRRGE